MLKFEGILLADLRIEVLRLRLNPHLRIDNRDNSHRNFGNWQI
jgi:hypothetical protein